ncbi:MAG: rhomboid family intramembrane serine protease [Clostridiales bacterium]|nr:rhomboid family intramembrane serine protease [Clostridiales bacterium]
MASFSYIYRRMDVTLRVIVVNAIVMVTVIVTSFITGLLGESINLATGMLDLPAGLAVITRPWSPFTYMFTQTDVMHCLFNMLWLYCFGRIYGQLASPRRLFLTYVAGGLAGAVLFTATSLIIPGNFFMLEGSSAAVMAIVAATAFTAPNVSLNFFLLGRVKIKWIAIATVVIFAVGLTGNNIGAHMAHLGGLAAGSLLALMARVRGRRYASISQQHMSEADARAELDRLLDKVRNSGYKSLTANERRRLIDLSNKV